MLGFSIYGLLVFSPTGFANKYQDQGGLRGRSRRWLIFILEPKGGKGGEGALRASITVKRVAVSRI
jgi:hypothetical protein